MTHPHSSAATSRRKETSPGFVKLPVLWASLAGGVALLAAVASAVGLLDASRIYATETVALADAATAQDIVTLLIVVPLLVFLSLRARAGSLPAFLCLPGVLAFAAYNYVIYTFSIHFGPLFLVWVAALGLSIFALIGALVTADMEAIKDRFASRTLTGTAIFLIVVSAFFAMLWLSEIVPDLLAGDPSRSASDWNIPTNPVHVLDLAFFLPAAIISGLLLKGRHPLGYATTAAQLLWLALTCLPILVTPLVANSRGHAVTWAVMIPIGTFLVAILIVLGRLLRHITTAPHADAAAQAH